MNKQAIMIIAHNNLFILNNILSSMDSKYFDFFIHIDKKSNIDINDIKTDLKYSKVYYYKEFDVRWADFSQIQCEMFLLNKAYYTNKYSYFHLISGVDFPIKDNKTLYNFFEKSQKEFVHFEKVNLTGFKKDNYNLYQLFMRNYRNNNIVKILNKLFVYFQKIIGVSRNKKSNIIFATGANWFSITEKFAEYVISKEKWVNDTFKFTRSGDEIFLQTILYNSDFINNVYNSDFDDNYIGCMRYIDWNRGNPYVFQIDDYAELVDSEFMFARKFDEKVDKKIIERLSNNDK